MLCAQYFLLLCGMNKGFSNSIFIAVIPATSTPSNSGSGNGDGDGDGNGSGNTIIVNIGKSSANGISSPSKIAIGVTVPALVIGLAGFLW